MSHPDHFDLFNFCSLQHERMENVYLSVHPNLKTVMRLKKGFFHENINSEFSTSSEFHDVYCSDTNSKIIDMAKSNHQQIHSDSTHLIDNINTFFNEMTQMYDPSMILFKVLRSCTYSVFTFFSERKNEHKDMESLGWIAYICDPTFGLFILFIHVKKEFRKKGIGTAMLQSLQLFSRHNTGSFNTLLWYTKVASSHSNLLVSYYRNLGFHPTVPSNYSLTYVLPADLVHDLNIITDDGQNEEVEFVLETKKKIEKLSITASYSRSTLMSEKEVKCEICGEIISDMNALVLCEYVLKGSFRRLSSTNAKKSICGTILCYLCQSSLGCTSLDRCPLHHEKEETSTKKKG